MMYLMGISAQEFVKILLQKDKIDKMHKANKFKMEPMPAFDLGMLSDHPYFIYSILI